MVHLTYRVVYLQNLFHEKTEYLSHYLYQSVYIRVLIYDLPNLTLFRYSIVCLFFKEISRYEIAWCKLNSLINFFNIEMFPF